MENFGKKPEDGKINKAIQYAKVAAIGAVGAVVGQVGGEDRMTASEGEKFDSLAHTPAGIYSVVGLGEEGEGSEVSFRDETGQNKFSVSNIPEDVKQKLIREYNDESHELRTWIQDSGEVKIIKVIE